MLQPGWSAQGIFSVMIFLVTLGVWYWSSGQRRGEDTWKLWPRAYLSDFQSSMARLNNGSFGSMIFGRVVMELLLGYALLLIPKGGELEYGLAGGRHACRFAGNYGASLDVSAVEESL